MVESNTPVSALAVSRSPRRAILEVAPELLGSVVELLGASVVCTIDGDYEGFQPALRFMIESDLLGAEYEQGPAKFVEAIVQTSDDGAARRLEIVEFRPTGRTIADIEPYKSTDSTLAWLEAKRRGDQ